MQTNIKHSKTGAPFDGDDADLVLLSSDRVAFHVSKLILSKASTVLKDMLPVLHPSGTIDPSLEYIDGNPVIRVTEDRTIMDPFLRCCYPVPSPQLSVSLLVDIHRAGIKYDAEAVKSRVYEELSRYAEHQQDCLQAYVIASHLGRKEEARRAAVRTIELYKSDITDWPSFPELELIPASTYMRLLHFRRECMMRVGDMCAATHWLVKEQRSKFPLWSSTSGTDSPPRCDCTEMLGWLHYDEELTERVPAGSALPELDAADVEDSFIIKEWCWCYLMTTIRAVHADDRPVRDALFDTGRLTAAFAVATACRSCRVNGPPALLDLLKQIEAEIPKVISEESEVFSYQGRIDFSSDERSDLPA